MSAKQQINVEIRPWSPADLPLLERLLGDPAMTEHIGGPETPEQIHSRHARYCQIEGTGSGLMFVILAGPERTPAGSIGYWARTWQGQQVWETGWSVLPEFQGQGVASLATLALIERARTAGLYRYIHAYPSAENAPSNAVCRKAGFTLQGPVDFEYPPGHMMRCNDWSLDLFANLSHTPA